MEIDYFEKVYGVKYVGGRLFIPVQLIGKITTKSLPIAEQIVAVFGRVTEPFEPAVDYVLPLSGPLKLQDGGVATALTIRGIPRSGLVKPWDQQLLADVGYVEPHEFILSKLEFTS